MIDKFRNYILDDNFRLIIRSGYINIINYKSLFDVNDSSVYFSYIDGSIKIIGKNIKVITFNEKEILLKGEFYEIKYK